METGLVTTKDTESLDSVVAWLFRVEPRAELRKYVVTRALQGRRFDTPEDLKRGIIETYSAVREEDILG